MKKTIIATIALCLAYSSAYAVDYFFDKSVGFWSVVGHPGSTDPSNKLNPACIANTKWDDGSYLNLISDLVDGELLIEFKSNEWNITDVDLDKQYELTLNMYTRNKSSVKSWPAKFNFLSKNTIQIRGIDAEAFLPAFVGYNLMVIIPPGTIPNANVGLENSSKAIDLMTQCFDASKSRKPLTTDNKPLQQGV